MLKSLIYSSDNLKTAIEDLTRREIRNGRKVPYCFANKGYVKQIPRYRYQ